GLSTFVHAAPAARSGNPSTGAPTVQAFLQSPPSVDVPCRLVAERGYEEHRQEYRFPAAHPRWSHGDKLSPRQADADLINRRIVREVAGRIFHQPVPPLALVNDRNRRSQRDVEQHVPTGS